MTWFGVDYIFSLIFGVLFFVLCLALWLLLLLFLLCVCPFHFLIFIYGLSGYWFENILKFVCAEKSVNLDCFDCYLSPYLLDSCRSLCDCCNIDHGAPLLLMSSVVKKITHAQAQSHQSLPSMLFANEKVSLSGFCFISFCFAVFFMRWLFYQKKKSRERFTFIAIQFNSILKCTLMFVSEFFFFVGVFFRNSISRNVLEVVEIY